MLPIDFFECKERAYLLRTCDWALKEVFQTYYNTVTTLPNEAFVKQM